MTPGLPRGVVVVGNRLYATCGYCRQFIRLDKPLFGSWHLCLTIEERAAIDRAEHEA